MAFSLQEIIFTTKFFSRTDINTDPNKDGGGKGTLQRYNEMVAEDYDDELQPLIDELVSNNLDPSTALAKFIIYLECLLGNPVQLSTTEALRRLVLQYATHFYTIRGTAKGYITLYSMIGLVASIVELEAEHPFDDALLDFDDDTRLLDSQCAPCSEYCVILTSTPSFVLSSDSLDAIFNIIEFNEPINAVLAKVELDGECIVQEKITILVTSSGDLTYDPSFSPGTTLTLGLTAVGGDLIISGTSEDKYLIDDEGDLIFVCE